MNEFLNLSKALNLKINLQIIKSFSLLVTNLSNKETLYYIFSNNFINDIISIIYNDNNNNDPDFLSYYINFIKTLSLKIDDVTINFFFHKQKNQFPILDTALKLYNYPDSMINNVVRNIFLTIIKIRSSEVLDYMCSLPNITYFIFLSYRVKDNILLINKNNAALDTVKNLYDDIVNDIIFFQDIFSLKINRITFILTNCLFHNLILPLVCFSLCKSSERKTKQKRISINVSMNVLLLFSFYIHDEHFLNLLFGILFFERISLEILSQMNQEPKVLSNYSYEYKKENEKCSFEMYLTYNYSYKFIKAISYKFNSKYSQIEEIYKKVTEMIDAGHLKNNENSDDVPKFILNELEKYLNEEQIDSMASYLRLISLNTGIQCNLFIKDQEQSPILQMVRYWKEIEAKNMSSNEVNNPIRKCIYKQLEFLDDNQVLLTGLLINILIKKNNINKGLLSISNLLPANDFIDIVDNINNISENNNFYNINSIDDNSYIYYSNKINNYKGVNKTNYANEEPQMSKLSQFALCSDNANCNDNNEIVIFNSDFFESIYQITQETYDKQLIDCLLLVFEGSPIYRPITLRIILNTIEALITKTNSFSKIYQEELKRINKVYITSIMDITSFLKKYDIIKSECYSLFENEWKRYNKDLFKTIDELLKLPYFFFPVSKEKELFNYPSILLNSKQPTDLFSVHLLIFMTFSDLRSKIYQDDKRIQSEFPLSFSSNTMEIGEKIPRGMIKMKFFDGKLKKEANGSFIDCSLFINQNFLISVSQDYKDKNLMVVKQKYPIRYFKISEDSIDSRNLLINTKGEEGNIVQIILIFQNSQMVRSIKDQLYNHCKNIESEEYILIESYFTEQMNQFDKHS